MSGSIQGKANKPIRVLSIDGGGMRGIVPATILETFENLSGQPISALFDVMVGTSTGSILAVGLNVPAVDKPGPRYSAKDFVKMYVDLGAAIFHEDRSLLKVLDGITRPTYNPSGYEKILHDYFGDTTMAQLLGEVAVPSIELEDMYMHVFSRARGQKGKHSDYFVKQVIRAATAAPTYFPAASVASLDNSNKGTFVDAGVSTNNPGVLAFAETSMISDNQPCIFVSLGTGAITKPIPALKARNWGEVEWLKAIFDLQGEAQSSYAEVTIKEILQGKPGSSYHRYQVDLHQLPFSMDDTRPEHLNELRQSALAFASTKETEIRTLTSLLLS
jgi:uncharacterized protein